jgi:hypothetical protein
MPAFTSPDGDPPIALTIVSDSPTNVVITMEIPKAILARHRRFIEQLLTAARVTN